MGRGASWQRAAVCVIAMLFAFASSASAQTPTQDQYGQPIPPPTTPQDGGTGTTPPGTTGPGTTDPGTTDPGTTDPNTPQDEDEDGSGGPTGGDSCNVTPAVSASGVSDTCPEGVADTDPVSNPDAGSNLPVVDSSGGLPFTGLALGGIVLLACLMLAAGLLMHSVQRWLGRRTA